MVIMGASIVVQGINSTLADIRSSRNELPCEGFGRIACTKSANACISINRLVIN